MVMMMSLRFLDACSPIFTTDNATIATICRAPLISHLKWMSRLSRQVWSERHHAYEIESSQSSQQESLNYYAGLRPKSQRDWSIVFVATLISLRAHITDTLHLDQ